MGVGVGGIGVVGVVVVLLQRLREAWWKLLERGSREVGPRLVNQCCGRLELVHHWCTKWGAPPRRQPYQHFAKLWALHFAFWNFHV